MTMPLSGNPITFLQLQTEFGGTATNIALGNYYAGGVRVPAGTPGYPNGGGPTGDGAVTIPASGALSLANFLASAKLTTATYDLQFGARTNNTAVTGNWTVPRLIVGNITITVIGGGGAGAGGPSGAYGGSGGGGAIRVISGADIFRSASPGALIPYQAGNRGYDAASGPKGGQFVVPSISFFGTSGQEWYIVGGRGQNANEGSNNAQSTNGGPGGIGSGTTPTYGTLSTGVGGRGSAGNATGTQGAGGGGRQSVGGNGTGVGFGGRGGAGNTGTGDQRNSTTHMGVWPGGGGGGTDSSGWYVGAFGAGGAVRIQGTWAY